MANGTSTCYLMPNCQCTSICLVFVFSFRVQVVVIAPRTSVSRHRHRSSVNFGGSHLCRKIYAWKIYKMPEFYMTFARKIQNAWILLDTGICPKDIFSFIFWGAGGGGGGGGGGAEHVPPLPPPPSLTPVHELWLISVSFFNNHVHRLQ